MYMCMYMYILIRDVWTRVSGLERWRTQPEKGKVRREPGGVAILTCKSFDMLWRKERKTNRTIHSS